jgi:hypothetical protein
MCASLHLEADPVNVSAIDLPENRVAYLQFTAEGYGDLNIFFPYENLEKVQEIARLIREATGSVEAPLSSASAEEKADA